MSFVFPDLSGTGLRFLTVCAECKDDTLAARFAGEDCEFEINYGNSDKIHLIVGRAGKKKATVHVHVDLAQESCVSPNRRKKTKPAAGTEQQLQRTLAEFLDKSVSACIHARFLVRPDGLPSTGYIAQQLGQTASVNGINALLMGQTLAAHNMDLQWFGWSVEQDGVSIIVHGERDTHVTETYLQEMRNVAEEWMRTVTNEGHGNGE